MLQGFTQSAAQIIDPARLVNPLSNWYFTAASTFLVVGLGWYLTDRIVEPRVSSLGVDGDTADMPKLEPLTPAERPRPDGRRPRARGRLRTPHAVGDRSCRRSS